MSNEEKKKSTFTWKEVLLFGLALTAWGFSFTAGQWIADKTFPAIPEATIKLHMHYWEDER